MYNLKPTTSLYKRDVYTSCIICRLFIMYQRARGSEGHDESTSCFNPMYWLCFTADDNAGGIGGIADDTV